MTEEEGGEEGGLEERGNPTSTGSFTYRGVCVDEMEEALRWGVVSQGEWQNTNGPVVQKVSKTGKLT